MLESSPRYTILCQDQRNCSCTAVDDRGSAGPLAAVPVSAIFALKSDAIVHSQRYIQLKGIVIIQVRPLHSIDRSIGSSSMTHIFTSLSPYKDRRP